MLSQTQNNCRQNCQNETDKLINQENQDKIKILDGNCSFDVNYLGYVEVFEPTNSEHCRESFAKLYQEYMAGIFHSIPSILWITGYELRIIDKSKNLILAQIIENVLFCASDTTNPDQLFYTCRDNYNRLLCHLFLVKNCSTDRLCRAIGFAFRICLKRKIIQEGPIINTTKHTRYLG